MEFFDSTAEHWSPVLGQREQLILQNLSQRIREQTEFSDLILDVGCGTGILFPFFQERKFIGLDFSLRMLARAQEHGSPDLAGLVAADAHAFPFKDASFGHIVFLSVIPHFDDRVKVFRQSHRILKSAGSLSVVHFLPAALINEIHSKAGGAIAHDYLPDMKELGESLSENGFKVEEFGADECYLLFARKCQ
jgi:demethylmenaquinone methyltransferase/2-methoxy-6-polyprenyl-1,4-benzoquinol methylase